MDIWSIGVILYATHSLSDTRTDCCDRYTLLVGKPPFQTKDVKNIYKKIKENNYEFPPNHDLSSSAIDLISQILNTVPDKRPTLAEILAHDFFLCGPFPPTISTSAMTSSPDYRKISVRASHRNFANVKMECGIVDVDPRLPASTSAAIASTSSDVASSSAVRNQRIKSTVLNLVGEEEEEVAVTSQQEVKMEGLEMLGAAKEVTGMEKEVREVLQPGSPISELLRSVLRLIPLQSLGNSFVSFCNGTDVLQTDLLENLSSSRPAPNRAPFSNANSSPKLVPSSPSHFQPTRPLVTPIPPPNSAIPAQQPRKQRLRRRHLPQWTVWIPHLRLG